MRRTTRRVFSDLFDIHFYTSFISIFLLLRLLLDFFFLNLRFVICKARYSKTQDYCFSKSHYILSLKKPHASIANNTTRHKSMYILQPAIIIDIYTNCKLPRFTTSPHGVAHTINLVEYRLAIFKVIMCRTNRGCIA